MFSFDSARLCSVGVVNDFSGVAFCVTGRRALLLSLLPMFERQSSSLIFFGDTSILVGDRCNCCCSCSACSRCSHFAKAAFFLTGDSERSLLVPVRVKNGSFEAADSYPLKPGTLYPELALLLSVGWRLGMEDLSVSLVFERVETVCRSGDDLVGL